mgnify:CR=1 FL=1
MGVFSVAFPGMAGRNSSIGAVFGAFLARKLRQCLCFTLRSALIGLVLIASSAQADPVPVEYVITTTAETGPGSWEIGRAHV